MRTALLIFAAFAVTGCGHGVSGRHLFASQCAHCHTLTGHDTRVEGGDLGGLTLTVGEVESFVRVMPVRRPLTARELRAVSSYVLQHR